MYNILCSRHDAVSTSAQHSYDSQSCDKVHTDFVNNNIPQENEQSTGEF